MEYEGHSWEVLDICVMPDNSKFASVGGDRSAFLFDVLTGKTVRKFSGHTQRINCCDFNDDASVLATGSYDATLRLWDLKSNSRIPIQILDDARDSVTSICIQEYEILCGSVDGHIRCYDIRTGNLTDDSLNVPVSCVSLAKDNTSFLASTLDSCVRLLDKVTGNVLNEYKGHTNTKYKIQSTFLLNDSVIVSGSEDSCLYFWDFIEGKIIQILEGNGSAVTSLSIHPTEPFMVTSCVDGSIQLWQ